MKSYFSVYGLYFSKQRINASKHRKCLKNYDKKEQKQNSRTKKIIEPIGKRRLKKKKIQMHVFFKNKGFLVRCVQAAAAQRPNDFHKIAFKTMLGLTRR